MSAADFTIKQYDTLPVISAILKVGGVVISDLAMASSVKLVLAKRNDPETYVFAKQAVIVNAANGQVAYQWVAGDTDIPGDYVGSWHITYADGKKRTVPTIGYFLLKIEPKLPEA
jgi:hypothetical protein